MKKVPIKTEAEIEIMRAGGEILKKVFEIIAKQIRAGVNASELDALAEKIILENHAMPSFKGYGASKKQIGFPATLCISINEEVVHGIPGARILKEGDIVGIDCGVFYQGFHTDSARTFLVGKVHQEVVYFVKTTEKALQKALHKVRDGARLGDVSETIQKTIEQRGYAVVRNCTGHGVGKELHEEPEILNYGKKGTGLILKKGMVLAIEPISVMGKSGEIFDDKDGWTVKAHNLSAHFENTVLVTESGCEILA